MASHSRHKYQNGFSGRGESSSPDMGTGRRELAVEDDAGGAVRPSTTYATDALLENFAHKKQSKSRSTFTLPRSWSAWRLKSSGDLHSKSLSSEGDEVKGGESIQDAASDTSEIKLKRRSSFRNMMDRFRRYRSVESLQERRRRPQRSPVDVEKVDVQYVQENVGRIVVPVVGLQNHGNSCYINAVVQCLNNTAQIYEFFITGRYRRDLQRRNRHNARKFGTQGELTDACGTLVQSLGRATYGPEISNALIQVVAKYWTQFHHGGEQDAQEFLIWLMEKMHEDLNKKARRKLKVRKSHKADDVLAAATEEANGSSIISRLFHALSRSSLTCMKCGQQSNTFEDYTCLPIPLPQTDIRPLFVKMVLSEAQSHIVSFGFMTSVDACVKDVRDVASEKLHLRPEELLLLEVNGEGFQRTLIDEHDSDAMQDLEDLFAVELLKPRTEEESHALYIVILHVTPVQDKFKRISAPRFIHVPRDITYQGLESSILSNLESGNGQVAPPAFRMRLVERHEYLKKEDDHPLLTVTVDQCLNQLSSSGLTHLKLYVEWEARHAEMVRTTLIRERYSEHISVQEVKKLPEAATATTLSDCLDLFMKEETVGMDEQWECPSCGALQIGITKKASLWTLPEILVIHLKRFRQTATTRFKLQTMVEFPLTDLDMSGYLTRDDDIDWRSRAKNGHSKKGAWLPWQKKIHKPPESELNEIHSYSLYGVVNHHGRLNSGHYTACCRHPADGTWYLYDDLRVKTIEDTADIVTKDAYILFYQREPLNTFPSLYYNDYSRGTPSSPSIFDLRTPTPRPSRSTDNLPEALAREERRNDADLTRTAQIYASLPRLPRRSVVHHPVGQFNGHSAGLLPAASPIVSNGHAGDEVEEDHRSAEYVYQRYPASSTLDSKVIQSGSSLSHVNGVLHPDDDAEESRRNAASQPQLIRYQQRPIQESCV